MLFSGRLAWFAGRLVLLAAEIVGGEECAVEDVFGGGGEADVSCAHAAPASGDGDEEIRLVGEEGLLQIGREHEVAVALFFGGEGREDVAADAEVGRAHVGGLFGIGEGQGDAAEVGGSHGRKYGRGGELWLGEIGTYRLRFGPRSCSAVCLVRVGGGQSELSQAGRSREEGRFEVRGWWLHNLVIELPVV